MDEAAWPRTSLRTWPDAITGEVSTDMGARKHGAGVKSNVRSRVCAAAVDTKATSRADAARSCAPNEGWSCERPYMSTGLRVFM
jgi:hypothetical protein